MKEFLELVLNSPLSTLLVLAGIAFLGIAVVGNISGKIQPGTSGRVLSGVVGAVLMGIGFVLYTPRSPSNGTMPTDGPVVQDNLSSTLPTTVPVTNTLVPTMFVSPTPVPMTVPAGFRVIEMLVRADPFDYSGACPVMITFTGRISVVGGSGTVSYKWIRNDGASAPVETLAFDGPGSKDISTTWYIGASGMSYSGWQALEIFDPEAKTSDHADFKIQCQ